MSVCVCVRVSVSVFVCGCGCVLSVSAASPSLLCCEQEMLATCMSLDPSLDHGKYDLKELFDAAIATFQANSMPFHSARCAVAAAAALRSKGATTAAVSSV